MFLNEFSKSALTISRGKLLQILTVIQELSLSICLTWSGLHLSLFGFTRKPCCRKETARCRKCSFRLKFANNITIRYDTIVEINVDSKAEYTA